MILETALGALTGIIGNVVSGIFKYKTLKVQKEMAVLENQHDLNMVKAETDAMIAESKANIAVTKAQVEGAVELKDAEAYVESQKAGNKPFFSNEWIDNLLKVEGKWKIVTYPVASIVAVAFGFVDFLRGLMRPFLTAYLTGVTTWITYMAWEIMNIQGISITSQQAIAIFDDVTSIVIYLTISSVTWWFGDRRMGKTIMEMEKPKRKNRNGDIVGDIPI